MHTKADFVSKLTDAGLDKEKTQTMEINVNFDRETNCTGAWPSRKVSLYASGYYLNQCKITVPEFLYLLPFFACFFGLMHWNICNKRWKVVFCKKRIFEKGYWNFRICSLSFFGESNMFQGQNLDSYLKHILWAWSSRQLPHVGHKLPNKIMPSIIRNLHRNSIQHIEEPKLPHMTLL